MPSRSLNASPSGLPRTSTAPVPPPTEADRDGPVAVARLSGTRSSKTPSAPTPSPETRPSSTSPISGSSPATGTSSPTPLSPRGRVPALLQPHEHLLRCSYGLRCHRQPRYLRIAYDRARSTRPTPPAGTAPANGASPPPTDPSAKHSTFVSTPPRFPASPGLASNSPAPNEFHRRGPLRRLDLDPPI